MKFETRVSNVTGIDGLDVDVEIEVVSLGGSSSTALETVERIEEAVQEEIKAIADEQGKA